MDYEGRLPAVGVPQSPVLGVVPGSVMVRSEANIGDETSSVNA